MEGQPKGGWSIAKGRTVRNRLSSEIVLKSNDIVFSEVGACLYLYKDEWNFAGILDSMRDAGRHIYGFSL